MFNSGLVSNIAIEAKRIDIASHLSPRARMKDDHKRIQELHQTISEITRFEKKNLNMNRNQFNESPQYEKKESKFPNFKLREAQRV